MGIAPAGKRWSTGQLIAGSLAVVALIGGGVTIGLSLTGDDGEKVSGPSITTLLPVTTGGATTSSYPAGTLDPAALGAGEVLLEPVNAPMAEPFMPTVGRGTEAAPTISLPSVPIPTTSAPLAQGQVALAQVAGREPGLYGGTRNAVACDVQSMISFLEQHPDKAAAWAGVQGIAVSEVRTFLKGLTPVILTRDTRVTNHGFRNGQAFAHPSVLQAGHAVLVDRWGVPRAKCSCGNPLSPPEPMSTAPVYVGPRWPTFDPTIIIVIIATEPVDDGFVIVDVDSGGMIVRPIGADPETTDLGTGDVRVTLRWTDAADLDLSVTDPNGETVSYGSGTVSSGGTLDVDANAPCLAGTSSPAENIIWPDTAPGGRYVVTVNYYNPCDTGDVHPYELTVFIGGIPAQIYLGTDDGGLTPSDGSGSVSSATPTVIYTFDRGGGIATDPGNGDPGNGDVMEEASSTILGQLLLDCGYAGTFTNLGPVEGGWYWSVTTANGEAEFLVYDPTGDWSVQPNNETAAAIAVECGFYSP